MQGGVSRGRLGRWDEGGLWGRDVATQPTGGGANWASPIVGKTLKKPKKLVSVG